MRLLEAGESEELDVDRTVRSRRHRVLRVWVWAMVIALVGMGTTVLLAALFVIDIGSSFFDNDSPPLSDEARTRLEQVQSSQGFATTPTGATETDSGMSDHSCFDWFDGGEPRVWRTLAAAEPAEVVARMQAALVRDGWSAVDAPSVLGGAFVRDFGGWFASVELVTDPASDTIALRGMVHGSVYCKPNGVD